MIHVSKLPIMTEWLHRIPVTKFFPENGDDSTQLQISTACKKIYDSMIENRVFLRYVELPESEIDKFTELADDFFHTFEHGVGAQTIRYPNAEEFDEAMESLYDWADKNRIWID